MLAREVFTSNVYRDADGRANFNRAVDVAVIKVLVLFLQRWDGYFES